MHLIPIHQHCLLRYLLNIDDVEISQLDIGSSPNLKVDDGPKLYPGTCVTSGQAMYTLV